MNIEAKDIAEAPPKMWFFVDVINYDTAPGVVIDGRNINKERTPIINENALKKNINGEEKERVIEKQKHSFKQKNRL